MSKIMYDWYRLFPSYIKAGYCTILFVFGRLITLRKKKKEIPAHFDFLLIQLSSQSSLHFVSWCFPTLSTNIWKRYTLNQQATNNWCYLDYDSLMLNFFLYLTNSSSFQRNHRIIQYVAATFLCECTQYSNLNAYTQRTYTHNG